MRLLKKKEFRNQVMILAAALIYSIGVGLFISPLNLAPGGVTGIAVILSYLSGLETGTLYFLINVPIILLGIWKFGIKFILKTAWTIVLISLFTNWVETYGAVTDDILLSGLAGGVLSGIGIGLTFKAGATTGGTDIIVKVIRQKYPHVKTGALFRLTDMVIVAASGLVFQDVDIMLYAALTAFIVGKVVDLVLYGGDEAKLIYIISDACEEIGSRLTNELDAGCTYLEGRGAWSNQSKQIIMTVVPKRTAVKVEELVKEVDAKAFMIENNASEIYGEGYKDIFAERI